MNRRTGTAICLFGALPVRVDGQPYRLGISGTTAQLFQFLLVNAGRECRREYLADLFWRRSSVERQRSALNSAIWRIKRQIREISGLVLYCDAAAICLQIDEAVPVDAAELSEVVRSITPGESLTEDLANRLKDVLEKCTAPYLDGVTSDWVLTERERLFNLQIRGLTILMHWLGQNRKYEEALEIGRRLLSADPARESAQCEVMWLYVLNGQRAQAIRQFHCFRAWLKTELNIEPMPETQALYDHIRRDLDGGQSRTTNSSSLAGHSPRKDASFDSLLGAIERSRRELFEVLASQSQ